MENFKVKNRLVYGGYIALLWLLGGLAFNVGAGVKLLGHLQAGVNYNFGLSKMARSVDDQMTIEMKRNTWQISLAYMF